MATDVAFGFAQAREGNFDKVSPVLEANEASAASEINPPTGDTFLHLAAMHGNSEVTAWLIARKARAVCRLCSTATR